MHKNFLGGKEIQTWQNCPNLIEIAAKTCNCVFFFRTSQIFISKTSPNRQFAAQFDIFCRSIKKIQTIVDLSLDRWLRLQEISTWQWEVHLKSYYQISKQSVDNVVIAIWSSERAIQNKLCIVSRSLGNFSGEKLIVNLVALWLEETAVAQYSITDMCTIQQHKNRYYWIEDP